MSGVSRTCQAGRRRVRRTLKRPVVYREERLPKPAAGRGGVLRQGSGGGMSRCKVVSTEPVNGAVSLKRKVVVLASLRSGRYGSIVVHLPRIGGDN